VLSTIVGFEGKQRVFSRLDGILKEVYVKEGDIVGKGMKLDVQK
jgi:multidrug efflux pump subunit AcrA (membrane-fusion protein)